MKRYPLKTRRLFDSFFSKPKPLFLPNMEVTLSAPTLFSISDQTFPTQSALLHSPRFTNTVFRRSSGKIGLKSPLFNLRAAVPPVWCQLPSGDRGIDDGGEVKVDDVSVLSPDVITLDVRGMTCGGCSASVKRILENQAQVSSASVNLKTGTAIVWPQSEAKATPNWQKVMGQELAKHLTTCGFSSNLRGEGEAS